MLEVKCPSCGAEGRIPRYKVNVRLMCKRCLKPFHVTKAGLALPGDPPIPKEDPRATTREYERVGAIDDIFSRIAESSFKLPEVSPVAVVALLGIALVVGALYWIFTRQGMEDRASYIATSLKNGEMQAVMEVCVPGTETEAMVWYADVYKKFLNLKVSLHEDPGVSVRPQGGSTGESALVVAQYARAGTTQGGPAFAETLQAVPSFASDNQTLDVPLFLVKDMWGDWLLDGKRTAAGVNPNRLH
jgi:hypothetical protein